MKVFKNIYARIFVVLLVFSLLSFNKALAVMDTGAPLGQQFQNSTPSNGGQNLPTPPPNPNDWTHIPQPGDPDFHETPYTPPPDDTPPGSNPSGNPDGPQPDAPPTSKPSGNPDGPQPTGPTPTLEKPDYTPPPPTLPPLKFPPPQLPPPQPPQLPPPPPPPPPPNTPPPKDPTKDPNNWQDPTTHNVDNPPSQSKPPDNVDPPPEGQNTDTPPPPGGGYLPPNKKGPGSGGSGGPNGPQGDQGPSNRRPPDPSRKHGGPSTRSRHGGAPAGKTNNDPHGSVFLGSSKAPDPNVGIPANSKGQALADAASNAVGHNLGQGTPKGLACSSTNCSIINNSGVAHPGNVAMTSDLNNALAKSGQFHPVFTGSKLPSSGMKKGDIVVTASQTTKSGTKHGHTGTYNNKGLISNNDSGSGNVKESSTKDWNAGPGSRGLTTTVWRAN